MNLEALQSIADAMVAKGKGILAADESSPTIASRFAGIDVEPTEKNRQTYRQMLFTTQGMADYISGVILYDETIRQSTDDGILFPKLLTDLGVLPGIKVDMGAKPLAFHEGEKVTEGLDGLRGRLDEYYTLGARFTKWRAVITIGDDIPSAACLDVNAHGLARYAALSQEAGLVPIVEPEVLMDGTHTIEKCEEITAKTLQAVFSALETQGVALEGICLKPNMVISGSDCSTQADSQQVAGATVRCLKKNVPASVPGIVFLSGGQSEEQAAVNLNEMSKLGPHPWELSFSYGRALQASALKAWSGESSKLDAGKKAFLHRSKCAGAARSGNYTEEMETAAV